MRSRWRKREGVSRDSDTLGHTGTQDGKGHGRRLCPIVLDRGELAEGSRTNIFLERDGKLVTPPLASGLLPGTFRAELLADGRAREAVLTLADLDAAETVYLGNSVRGLVRAMPVAK